ncbi:MAG: Smr/MutS family protein [Bacteroidota bacterium]
MAIKAGDKISFLDHTGTGVVVEIYTEKKSALIKTEEGLEVVYLLSKIVKKPGRSEYTSSAAEEEKLLRNKILSGKNKNKISKSHHGEKEMEIDLHIHELVDDLRGLSNTDMLRIQVIQFRKKMAEAIEKRVTKLIIIHGVGEGVLKAEIRHALLDYPNVSSGDADYLKYGKGATEVRIRYN